MKYKVTKESTLLEALAVFAPDSSKTTLRSWLKEGRIRVDEKIEKIATTKVLEGQTITLQDKAKLTDQGDIRIIYEDQHIIAIDKPSGLLSVSTAFEPSKTAHGFLKKYFKPKKIYVVHRLDQDTSGVMIFALSEEAYINLKEMFELHELERAYTAIVEGNLDESEGTWKSYLIEDENYFVRETHNENAGRLAITHYNVLKSSRNYSALVLRLETGRKNQIRVHCQNAGHSIVGDKKYGATSNPIKRLCLHAHLLAFEHPITKKKMHFESPLPDDLKKLVQG
jgi:tRNA pseudouridine32 synthase/23S rRNA pseudouridine746 synthase/23S rRNA pseudouridine1911/1915/1917 synthase